MKIVYRPENGTEREWPFEPNKMQCFEAEAIESVTGWTFQEFGEKFLKGSTMAYHALLWVLLRRDNRSLKYRDVTFRMDELDVRFDKDELDALREAVEDPDSDLTDRERDEYLAILADATEDEPENPTEPKADDTAPVPSPKRKSSTKQSSPTSSE